VNQNEQIIPTRPLSLAEFKKKRRPIRDENKEFSKKLTKLDQLALWITVHVGTMGFFSIILIWTVMWLGWNLLAPVKWQFDPPMGFVFWLFISNVLQILLMPLIMVGQNVQGRRAEVRAENDLYVNVKAEEEIEVILQHLEYQNSILLAMLEKLGIDIKTMIQTRNK